MCILQGKGKRKEKRKTLSKDIENFMKVQNGNINSNGFERREKNQWCETLNHILWHIINKHEKKIIYNI
jgi:hypothetical protein